MCERQLSQWITALCCIPHTRDEDGYGSLLAAKSLAAVTYTFQAMLPLAHTNGHTSG